MDNIVFSIIEKIYGKHISKRYEWIFKDNISEKYNWQSYEEEIDKLNEDKSEGCPSNHLLDNLSFIVKSTFLGLIYFLTNIPIYLYYLFNFKKIKEFENEFIEKYIPQNSNLRTHSSLLLFRLGEIYYLNKKKLINIEDNSLEIGIADGSGTKLHDLGGYDFGIEYSPAYGNRIINENLWENSLFANITSLPFKPEFKFNTIVAIHVIDHIPSLDKALKELSLYCDNGGELILTGFTDQYEYSYPRSFLWNFFGKKKHAHNSYNNNFFPVRKNYNHLSLNEWLSKLKEYDFRVKDKDSWITSWRRLYYFIVHYYIDKSGGYYIMDLIDDIFEKKLNLPRIFSKLRSYATLAVGAAEYNSLKNETKSKKGIQFIIYAQKQV